MLTNHSLPQKGSALPFNPPPNKRAISKWTLIINQYSILWNLGVQNFDPPKKTWLEGKHCLKWPLPWHASWIVRNTSIAWSYQYLSMWHAWNVANLGPPEMLNSWLVVNWRSFEAQNRTNSVSLLASSKQTDRPPFPCHWIHSDKELWPKHEAIQSDLKHSAASLYMAVSRQVFGRNAGNCVQTHGIYRIMKMNLRVVLCPNTTESQIIYFIPNLKCWPKVDRIL